jgi:hypothetical protein
MRQQYLYLALRMLNRFLHTAVWVAFGIAVTVMLINAFCMVISPEAWFRLPRWLGLQGVLTSDRYGSGGGQYNSASWV